MTGEMDRRASDFELGRLTGEVADLNVDVAELRKEVKILTGNMNKGKGALAALLFAASSAGTLIGLALK